MQQQIFVIPK